MATLKKGEGKTYNSRKSKYSLKLCWYNLELKTIRKLVEPTVCLNQ